MAVERPSGVAEQGFVWDLRGVHPPADGLLGVDQGFQSARRPVHLAEQQVQTLGALGGPLHAARGRALAPGGPRQRERAWVSGFIGIRISSIFTSKLYL